MNRSRGACPYQRTYRRASQVDFDDAAGQTKAFERLKLTPCRLCEARSGKNHICGPMPRSLVVLTGQNGNRILAKLLWCDLKTWRGLFCGMSVSAYGNRLSS